MIGRILGKRYEILERIGGGGMAVVYRARCTYLNRTVAVKVLRSQFTADDEFVKRFEREAQAAASLTHPNVVSVYDVGVDADIHYIVMEYVPGLSLKEKIQKEGRIEQKEALRIASQICEALEHAHRHGVIHRDVKPHNILLADDGRVKVTDFGIARAANCASITLAGTILGSAYYFSPEQARGEQTGERSDIYSAGIVFYEMLTGKVPFSDGPPLAIARKHVEEEIPPPSRLVPEVHPEVDRVVMKALRKEPQARYPSASEMLADLRKALRILDNQGGRGRHAIDEGDQAVGDPVVMRKDNSNGRRPRSRLLVIVGTLVLLALCGYAGASAARWLASPTVKVPQVQGTKLEDAVARLRESGLRPVVAGERWDDRVPKGHVISQDPEPDKVVRKGRQVDLVVSRGAELVRGGVPSVVGRLLEEAEMILRQNGLALGQVVEQESDKVPKGYVLGQFPEQGTELPRGESVDLVVSKGISSPTVPNVVGEPLSKARSRLEELGIKVGSITRRASDMPRDTVLDQEPRAGTRYASGDSVRLVVSTGDSALNETELKVKVPPGGPADREVRIELDDSLGSRTVYRNRHKGGESFVFTVPWSGGSAMVRVFVDESLVSQQVLR